MSFPSIRRYIVSNKTQVWPNHHLEKSHPEFWESFSTNQKTVMPWETHFINIQTKFSSHYTCRCAYALVVPADRKSLQPNLHENGNICLEMIMADSQYLRIVAGYQQTHANNHTGNGYLRHNLFIEFGEFPFVVICSNSILKCDVITKRRIRAVHTNTIS